jgi:hypothetical protein
LELFFHSTVPILAGNGSKLWSERFKHFSPVISRLYAVFHPISNETFAGRFPTRDMDLP